MHSWARILEFHADGELADKFEPVGLQVDIKPKFVLSCGPLFNVVHVHKGARVDLGDLVGPQSLASPRGGRIIEGAVSCRRQG